MITVSGFNVKFSTFPGGEEYVKLEWAGRERNYLEETFITARLTSSSEVMRLLMVTDALRRRGFRDISLNLGYVPYARQDRVCAEGESLSIKVFADLINSQKYQNVEIYDPHSTVTPALLDNCGVCHPVDYMAVSDDRSFIKWLGGTQKMED